MARTPGAKDKRPRRKCLRGPGGRFLKILDTAAQAAPAAAESSVITDSPSQSEFDKAVEAVLGQAPQSQAGTVAGTPAHDPIATDQATSPPAAIESDVLFGIDGWEAIIQAPFRSAAIWLAIPALEQLGKLRSQMLAKPSYPLYRHYVTKWLTDNPDDELFVSKIMTGAAVATVLQEAWIIIAGERAKRARDKAPPSRTVPVEALHTQN